MTLATAQGSGRGWLLPYLGAALIWGCSFLFIKVGLEALSPIHVAFGRQALGSVALLILAAVTRVRLPRDRRTWAHLFVVGLLMNSVPSTLFALGETHISSVVAGIINAVTPLTTILVMFLAFRSDRPTAATIAGILLGFAGILVVVGLWNGVGSNEALGVLACLGAVACYGIGFPYIRRNLAPRGERPLALAAAQITLDIIALLDLSRRPTEQVVFGNKWIWVVIVLLVNTLGAIIYLVAGRKPAAIAENARTASPPARIENIADTLYGPRDDTDPR